MPTNKAVVDVVEKWSGKRPEKMLQNLEEWWNQTAPGSSHSALSFDPDGIEDLLRRLREAFPSSPVLESGDFRSSGNVKTVQDLVDALQPTVAEVAPEVSVTGNSQHLNDTPGTKVGGRSSTTGKSGSRKKLTARKKTSKKPARSAKRRARRAPKRRSKGK